MRSGPISTPYYRVLTAAEVAAMRGYYTGVYFWMVVGLVITAAVAGFFPLIPGVSKAFAGRQVYLEFLVGGLGMALLLNWGVSRMTAVPAAMCFVFYAACWGGFFQFIVPVAGIGSQVMLTCWIAACAFGLTALFGYITRRDLTRNSSIALLAALGLGLPWVLNRFFPVQGMAWYVPSIIILYFGVLIAFEAKKLMQMSLEEGVNGLPTQFDAVIGALQIYLDFLLFPLKLIWYVLSPNLRLFTDFSDNDHDFDDDDDDDDFDHD